jgi:predicted nucleic acid-binding protein
VVVTRWLIDKSALWKLPRSRDYATWVDCINRGEVSISLPTRLEVAVSARDREHWPLLKRDLLAPLLDAYATPRSEAVAVQLMDALVERGLHRSVALPDVMVASVAVAEGLTVLHDAHDFERIHQAFGGPVVQRLELL